MIQNPPRAYTPPVSDLPDGALAQTFPRWTTGTSLTLTAQRLVMGRIYLPPGLITSITFITGSTALAGGAHGWAALFDASRGLLGQSADDTAITWAANTAKTFTLNSPIAVQAGHYYVGLMVDASTPPSVLATLPGLRAGLLDPPLGGLSTTSLTTTAPATAAVWGTSNLPYAYVS